MIEVLVNGFFFSQVNLNFSPAGIILGIIDFPHIIGKGLCIEFFHDILTLLQHRHLVDVAFIGSFIFINAWSITQQSERSNCVLLPL